MDQPRLNQNTAVRNNHVEAAFAEARIAPRRREAHPIEAEGVAWVCAAVQPGREFRVADDLEALGFRVFCPHGVRVHRRVRAPGGPKRGGYAERDYPIFGAYVFVGQPANGRLALTRRSHRFILRLLDEGRPHVPTRFIREACAHWLAGSWDARRKGPPKIPAGSVVRFTQGPLLGFNALVESLRGETRAVVSLGLFGASTITVDVDGLEVL